MAHRTLRSTALTGFATIETPYFRGEDADFTDGLPMHALAGWEISGLWIEFGDRGLLVYSGADMNGLSADPLQPLLFRAFVAGSTFDAGTSIASIQPQEDAVLVDQR